MGTAPSLWVAQRASHTEGETTVSATDEISPKKPPITAPLVVQSFHETLMNSTGKLAEAAMANASDTLMDQVILHGVSPALRPKIGAFSAQAGALTKHGPKASVKLTERAFVRG